MLTPGLVEKTVEEALTSGPASAEPAGEPAARKRVLVVDDDPGVLGFAAEALDSFRPGFEVATARSGEQALAWLEGFRPHLILVSCGRSGEAGDGLRSVVVGDPRTAHCKIIAMSESLAAEMRLNPARLRVHATLTKPLKLKTLLSTVRRLILTSPK